MVKWIFSRANAAINENFIFRARKRGNCKIVKNASFRGNDHEGKLLIGLQCGH